MSTASIDLEHYKSEGYAVVKSVFSGGECDGMIEHMMDLHAGRKQIEGFAARAADEWGRTHNQHWYDDVALSWLIHSNLHQGLVGCIGDEPEGIQTMYFWKGSEQRRHQDQYYLPACMSVWIALMDVDQDNGTIYVQPGSHQRRLITKADFAAGGEFCEWDYNDAVDLLFERNGLPEVPVVVEKGDVVFFHGVLVHHGGPIRQRASFRHVLANHYIPYGFDAWPLTRWPRIAFDGKRRFSE